MLCSAFGAFSEIVMGLDEGDAGVGEKAFNEFKETLTGWLLRDFFWDLELDDEEEDEKEDEAFI